MVDGFFAMRLLSNKSFITKRKLYANCNWIIHINQLQFEMNGIKRVMPTWIYSKLAGISNAFECYNVLYDKPLAR